MRNFSENEEWKKCVDIQFTNILNALGDNEEACKIVKNMKKYTYDNLDSILEENSRFFGKENCCPAEPGQRNRFPVGKYEKQLYSYAQRVQSKVDGNILPYFETLFLHFGCYGLAIHKERLTNWIYNNYKRKLTTKKK